jgi:hypothetical protein
MKLIYFLKLSGILFLMSSCASLATSQVDEKLRFQGSFTCARVSEEKPNLKETLALADVSRIRCARDEWRIELDQVKFIRTLYQAKNCDVPLGRIEFTSHYEAANNKLSLSAPHCKLLRLTPGWVGEQSGKCMFNQLALNKTYPLTSMDHCPTYIPAECKSDGEGITIESNSKNIAGHAPYDSIFIKLSSGQSQAKSCERYASD